MLRNPFHVHELVEDELRAMLDEYFENTCLFGQRSMCGSRIESRDERTSGHATAFQLESHGDEWRESSSMRPMYLLAVASRGAIPALPRESILSDFGQELVHAARRDGAEEALRSAAAEVGELRACRDEAEEALRSAAAQVGELRALASRKSGEAERLQARLGDIQATTVWRLRGRVHRMLGGTDSSTVRTVSRSIRRAERFVARRRLKPVAFPVFAEPIVSIVIPVHDGFDITARCLRAVSEHTDEVPYEVIVVADGADTETRKFVSKCRNLRLVVNEQNLGYLRSVNRGCREARGRLLVLLNNDTQPEPGWLAPLARRADSNSDVGVVVPKLMFPNGRLQEAGSIVWRDGSASNYGCRDDPDAPTYNFARDVDYGSAAALMIDARLWREIGGFDERYAPGYYEDVDLCFAVRDRGLRVVYEPVVHGRPRRGRVDGDGCRCRPEAVPGAQSAHVRRQVDGRAPTPAAGPCALAGGGRSGSPSRCEGGDLRPHRSDARPGRGVASHGIDLVNNLSTLGLRVSFVPANLYRCEPYARDLQTLGVEVLYGDVDIAGYLTAIAAETEFVVVSRPDVASRFIPVIRECLPDAQLVYDTVDLHHVRETRRAEIDQTTGTEQRSRGCESSSSSSCGPATSPSL